MNDTYHDAIVFKVEYIHEQQILIIGIKTTEQKVYNLNFEEPIGWVFSPFQTQNVLFEFRIYTNDNVPKSIFEEYGIDAQYRRILESDQRYSIALLNPSVGLGGFIIFKHLISTLIE
jgi:hypothetical protein